DDVIEGRVSVGVEGRGGADIREAADAGLFTTTVNGIPIFAQSEADAAPLISYLEDGGAYGTPEFSRLLGYTPEQVSRYEGFLSERSQREDAEPEAESVPDYLRRVADESTDPDEVLSAYLMAQDAAPQPDPVRQAIAENFVRVSTRSFDEFGDPNL